LLSYDRLPNDVVLGFHPIQEVSPVSGGQRWSVTVRTISQTGSNVADKYFLPVFISSGARPLWRNAKIDSFWCTL